MGMGENIPPVKEDNKNMVEAVAKLNLSPAQDPIMDPGDLNLTEEELLSLDNQLDQLTKALDSMETKRDYLHQELTLLLQQSQEIRKEISASQKEAANKP